MIGTKTIQKFFVVNRKKILIILFLLLTGYLVRILSEISHELLGHGLFTVLFGGSIESVHISLISPFDISHITLNRDDLTFEQNLIVIASSMIVDLSLSFTIQIFLLIKRIDWKKSVPLIWFAFWCHNTETGIIIGNSVSRLEGDMTGLIEAGIISAAYAFVLGVILYFIGFVSLSTIIRRLLISESIDESKVGYYVLLIWMIVPLNVTLHALYTGFLLNILFGTIPVFTSLSLEFLIVPKISKNKTTN